MINEWEGELNTTVNKDKGPRLVCPWTETSCIQRGCRKWHTKIYWMDRFWRLYLTLRYDSRSVLLTFWHVKGPGSAKAEIHVDGGVTWDFVWVQEGKQRRPKCVKRHHPQAPLWAEPELTFLKSCFNVKQSRWGTNKNAPSEVVWGGRSMPQGGHIKDWAGTQNWERKNSAHRHVLWRAVKLSAVINRLGKNCYWLAAFIYFLF